MGIVSRLREASAGFVARHLPGEALSFSAELPGSRGALWKLRLDLDSQDHAEGRQLRLRAHWRVSIPARAAVTAAPSPSLPARLGLWLERRAQSPALRPLLEPLLDRDMSSWMEIRASDAALDAGSQALLPERLAALGVQVRNDRPVQSWAGELGGTRAGFGVITLLGMDKRQLPERLRRHLGDKPFHLAATLATAIEESPRPE